MKTNSDPMILDLYNQTTREKLKYIQHDPDLQSSFEATLLDPHIQDQMKNDPSLNQYVNDIISTNPQTQQQLSMLQSKLVQGLAQTMFNQIIEQEITKNFEQSQKEAEDEGFLAKCCHCMSIRFWQQYFNVTTEKVKERIISAFRIPFSDNFFELMGQQPDMYGPFWVNTSIIFVVTAASNFGKLLLNSQADYDFSYVPQAISLVYSFGFIFPLIIGFLMKQFGTEKISYLNIISIYGYANSVMIPTIIACSIPNSFIQWIFMAYATIQSTFFLVSNFNTELEKYAPERKQIFIGVVGFLQVFIMFLFKFYFFGVFVSLAATNALQIAHTDIPIEQHHHEVQRQHHFINSNQIQNPNNGIIPSNHFP